MKNLWTPINFQVEELELKSALARNQNQKINIPPPKIEPVKPVYHFDSVHVINEQKLNLFTGNCNQSVEEYDEEWKKQTILFQYMVHKKALIWP